jgi:hypothetical protein
MLHASDDVRALGTAAHCTWRGKRSRSRNENSACADLFSFFLVLHAIMHVRLNRAQNLLLAVLFHAGLDLLQSSLMEEETFLGLYASPFGAGAPGARTCAQSRAPHHTASTGSKQAAVAKPCIASCQRSRRWLAAASPAPKAGTSSQHPCPCPWAASPAIASTSNPNEKWESELNENHRLNRDL